MYDSSVHIAMDATAAGYPIAGFIRELYEGAEVYIPPPFVEGVTLAKQARLVLEGTILAVCHAGLLEFSPDKRVQFVIEDGDLQIPLAFGGDRICFFKMPKIPEGISLGNTPGEVIEF